MLRQAGVRFVNLQYGESAADLLDLQTRHGVAIHDWPEGDPLIDLDDFAAKVAALDLVISVGNTTVHLAGALGVPVWVLLPTVPGWRWLIEGETNPWYASVRAIRQNQHGNWTTVFEEAARRLESIVGKQQANPSRPTESKGTATQSLPKAPINGGDRSMASGSFVPTTFNLKSSVHQALQLVRSGDVNRAEPMLHEILVHAPRNVAALHQLGLLARQDNRTELAIRMLARAAAAAENNATIYLDLARTQHAARQLADAAASYQRAIAINPALPEAHFELGAVCRDLGKLDDAATAYRRTIELSPAHAKAFNHLGASCIELHRFDEAEQAFRRAIELAPNYTAAHNNLGCALHRLSRTAEAVGCFEAVIASQPDNIEARANLAELAQKRQTGRRLSHDHLMSRSTIVFRCLRLWNPNSARLRNSLTTTKSNPPRPSPGK